MEGRADPGTPPLPTTLRVLFVCLHDFRDASAKQALWFANELVARGHAAMFSFAGDPATALAEGGSPAITFRRHRFSGPRVSRGDVDAAREFAPDLIHCWNPRRAPVLIARTYAAATGARVVVHWEDDEWQIRSAPMGRSVWRLALRPGKRVLAYVRPELGVTMDEVSRRWIKRSAAGLDALTPALADYVAGRMERDCEAILPPTPAAEPAAAGAYRWPAAIGDAPVALWTGSVHPALRDDVRGAMAAVAEVRRRGRPLAFVHVGEVMARFDVEAWIREAGLGPESAQFLGYVPYEQVQSMLGSAAMLLSSGAPNAYNRLRLPSKVQAYLASGTPTITYGVGLGELLADGEEAVLTRTAEPSELADRMLEILTDSELRRRLRSGGPAAGRRLFDPVRNTDVLLAYYGRALAR